MSLLEKNRIAGLPPSAGGGDAPTFSQRDANDRQTQRPSLLTDPEELNQVFGASGTRRRTLLGA